jgi:hypothetical protein
MPELGKKTENIQLFIKTNPPVFRKIVFDNIVIYTPAGK